jgi:hypothetical protein
MSDRSRTTRALCFLLVVATVTMPVGTAVGAPGVAGADDAASEVRDLGATWSTPVAQMEGGDGPTIHQRGIVSRNDEPGSVTLTLEYEVPSSVTGLRVGVPVVGLEGITVESLEGFEQTSGARFLWDTETETPSITLRMAVGDSLTSGVRGVEREDWAFVSEPNTRIQVRSEGQPVQTSTLRVADGEPGYADSHQAYMGEHDRRNATVADERATFVLGAADADPTRAIEFLRTANERFDFGVRHEAITVFVLPVSDAETEDVSAATVDTSMWVTSDGLAFDETGAVFAHEYVHTRLGTTGRASAAWLTEATAEYYGRLFAFNDGVGSYDAFLEGLRASEYAPDRRSVTLSEPETWQGTTAHYTKGAHVLAALDARIRERTNGDRTLRAVFEGRTEPFRNHREFRAAVVEVAGDESVGTWLDEQVTTDALPPLPSNPRYYVADPALDPDGDGVDSGTEIAQGRHPFVDGAPLPAADEGTAEGETTSEAAPPTTADDGATTESDPTTSSGGAPGFGAIVAALAVVLAGLTAAAGRR